MRLNLCKLRLAAGRVGVAAAVAVFVAFGIQTIPAQSSDVNFPTPLSSSKLSGTIKARDIGDNRLTTHYFVFNGTQGDLFVNVVAKNLDADIDVFAADGLIPLAKMVVASDAQANETGRLIYLRKPEKLILRLQGRTPNDLPATYQISFGGGFAAIVGQDSRDAPVVDQSLSGEVAVNSVGTILPQPKKVEARSEPAKPVVDKAVEAEAKKVETAKSEEATKAPKKAEATRPTDRKTKRRSTEVVVTESIEPKKEVAAKAPAKKSEKRPKRSAEKEKKPEPPKAETATPIDPLANVKLVILFKSGEKVEIGMPDLMKFTVDRGQLLVIRKTGSIDRYSMLDVAKVTIE
ncbi:MAG TPA: hypothetical protein PLR83_03130 [Pyrinomonadaceae bacterium]|nr:hypothetical protein [Pyrinomonadaceae bacterium]